MGRGQHTNGRHMNVHGHRRTVTFLQFGRDLTSFLHLLETQSASAFDDKLMRIQQITDQSARQNVMAPDAHSYEREHTRRLARS
jgi:hypothetical protein